MFNGKILENWILRIRHWLLLIRALIFRQDYRIKKIFLPFRKKGKKHHPSSREGVQSLCQQNSKAREKAPVIGSSALFFAEAELCFLGFIWKP
jgi:hypothetical protein